MQMIYLEPQALQIVTVIITPDKLKPQNGAAAICEAFHMCIHFTPLLKILEKCKGFIYLFILQLQH